MADYSYIPAWKESKQFSKYSNSLSLFALTLRFNIDDVDTLASTSLTEGSDDKGIDIYI